MSDFCNFQQAKEKYSYPLLDFMLQPYSIAVVYEYYICMLVLII